MRVFKKNAQKEDLCCWCARSVHGTGGLSGDAPIPTPHRCSSRRCWCRTTGRWRQCKANTQPRRVCGEGGQASRRWPAQLCNCGCKRATASRMYCRSGGAHLERQLVGDVAEPLVERVDLLAPAGIGRTAHVFTGGPCKGRTGVLSHPVRVEVEVLVVPARKVTQTECAHVLVTPMLLYQYVEATAMLVRAAATS